MALAVFVGLQIAMPQLVRPHLIPPTHSNVEITASNLDDFGLPRDGRIQVRATAADTGAWVLSSHTVDASGHAVDTIPVSTSSGPCEPPESPPGQARAGKRPGDELSPCLAELTRLGYRQQVTDQPSSRFWRLQWDETGIYTALALCLTGSASGGSATASPDKTSAQPPAATTSAGLSLADVHTGPGRHGT